MKKTLFILLFSSIISIGYTNNLEMNDEEEGYVEITTNNYKNYIGFCLGVTYYYGISYKRWFKGDEFAFHFHLFPLIYKKTNAYGDNETYTRGIIKGGLTFLKTIKSYRYVRLLYYLNSTLSYDLDSEYQWDSDENTSRYKQVEEVSIGGSIGPGFEFYVWRFAFDVLLGVSTEINTTTSEYRIVPAAETAVFFRF